MISKKPIKIIKIDANNKRASLLNLRGIDEEIATHLVGRMHHKHVPIIE